MTENSLVNLGELSRPATALVEKIAEAVGGVFRPFQMVRTAKAEAEVRRIQAQSQIQVSDLERRAMQRWIQEETRKQSNMERIAAAALPLLKEDSSPQKVSTDWMSSFFEKCRIVSDTEMQQLWSRVLAGEANAPGTFARKTVNLLADLDKSDAELFAKLCGFAWRLENHVPLVFLQETDLYSSHGLRFSTFAHLESLGLAVLGQSSGFYMRELPRLLTAKYHGRSLELTLHDDGDNSLDIGRVIFTRAGEQLAAVCGSSPVEGFFEFVRDRWTSIGLIRKLGDVPVGHE